MAYYPGQVVQPEIQFITGERCILVRELDVQRHGVDFKRLIMKPEPFVKMKHNIKDEDLDFTASPDGCIIKDYPKEYFFPVSSNPENPVIWMLCSFKAESVLTTKLSEMKAEKVRLEKRMKTMLMEIEDLREELQDAYARISDLQKSLRGEGA